MQELSEDARAFFRQKGREGGKKRAQNLSLERIKEIASKAGKAKKKPKKQKETHGQ